MRHRILQYNTDDFSHGSDYFAEVTANVDFALLQRLPIKNELSLINEIHLERSISDMPSSLYVAIAKFEGRAKFSSHMTYALPSTKIVKADGHKFQGSKAICRKIGKIIFCSVLPCYPNSGTIKKEDTLEDVRFLLNRLKHTRCIIAGDFHHVPGEFKELEDLIKKNGFTSYLDEYDTFVHPSDSNTFNLDRMISNIPDLTVENIIVHQPDKPSRHLAITYEVNYS
jgi:hypothetical protein